MDGHAFTVRELIRRRHEPVDEEMWVGCDNCRKWQHVVCALHNIKRNDGLYIAHYCPHCMVGHMNARGKDRPIAKARKGAAELQTTRLSEHLQARLRAMLDKRQQEIFGDDLDAAVPGPGAAKAPSAEGAAGAAGALSLQTSLVPELLVRMVSHQEKTLFVGSEFLQRYGAAGYPSQLTFRSKALTLWQNLDGADVLLYAIYVQEFGDDCGEPNRRTAYLSYLDSVKYLEPPLLRTDVYKEVLLAYLEDLKARGFNQITLWS